MLSFITPSALLHIGPLARDILAPSLDPGSPGCPQPHPVHSSNLPGRRHWTVSVNSLIPVLQTLGTLAVSPIVDFVSQLRFTQIVPFLPGIHPVLSHHSPMPHCPAEGPTSLFRPELQRPILESLW